jgi:putative transposase
VSVFRLIAAEKAEFPIAFMCQRLGVSTSGYYAWQRRGPAARALADAELTGTIRQIHLASCGTYGAPRVHAERGEIHQVHCGRKRVARLMRATGLAGLCRCRSTRTEARIAVFDYLEGFYNPRRRHSALAYLSPAQYERRHHLRNTAA